MLRYLETWIEQLRSQRLNRMEKLAHMLLDHLQGILLRRRRCGHRDMNYLPLKAQHLAATQDRIRRFPESRVECALL